MSRLTEYLPELTGVVFAEDDEYEKMRLALGGGTTGTTTGGTTAAKPAEKPYYESLREQNLKLGGFKELADLAKVGGRFVNDNTIVTSNGSRYVLEPGQDIWKAQGGTYNTQRDRDAYNAGTPVGGGGGGTPGGTTGTTTTGGTPGVLPGVRSDVSPEARQFGGNDFTSLPNSAGVSIPGWEAYRQPGIGIPDIGRQQLTDRTGLNQIQAGRQGSLTQFPVAPGFRNAGQVGNSINFGDSGSGKGNSQLASTLEPQMLLPPTTANVPGSYVQGQGNVGDANRMYSLPFNIGPGGAALANVGGNNVQVNGPPGSGQGWGTVLNAMPASNVFAATGRNPSEDPALQAMQSIQLQSLLSQFGGGSGALDIINAVNANQFGGNRAGTGNGPFSGNGGAGQGNWWQGYSPDPLGATPGATPGVGGGGGAMPEGYQSSAGGLFERQGAGYMGGAGAGGGAPYQSSGADLFAGGGRGYMGGAGTRPGGGSAADLFAQGGAGYMGGAGTRPGGMAPAPTPATNPLLGNVQQSLAAGLPPPAGVTAPPATLLAQLQAQRDRDEQEGGYGGGYGPDGGQRGFNRGGMVYAGLPGFAASGTVNTAGGPGGTVNPIVASSPIDASLSGDLSGGVGGAGSSGGGPGGAVQTNPTASTDPADNAIQPVQSPQNNTAIVPAGGTNPVTTTNPVATNPAPVMGTPPAQTAVPNWTYTPQSGLGLDVLNQFNQSVARQAQQARLRDTFSNRWQAAGVQAPTAIQLQPGQEMPTETLAPGQYYDISEALKSLMGDIRGSQTELAGLGEIGDAGQIMAYLSGLEVEQAPYQKAQDIKLQLAGLGQSGQGDPGGLMQQQEALKQQMGPLSDILDLREKLTGLGGARDTEGAAQAIEGLERRLPELKQAQAEAEKAGQPLDPALANELATIEAQLPAAKGLLSANISHNNELRNTQDAVNNLIAKSGLPPEEVANQLGTFGAQMDALKQQYQAAMQGESYRNQMVALIGNADPTAELGRLGALIGTAKTNYGNVEKARQLNNRIGALAQRGAKLPGFARGGSMTVAELAHAGAGNRISRPDPPGRRVKNSILREDLPEFAKGGNWIAGATSNSHGQFRAKAKAAGMSTKAYASKMSDAPGRTGKQARLAKTLMGFADGGNMTTQEPIVGIGMFTGRPRFQVGEPQYPGGPPMAERLSITPLNRPSALPMGRMRSAA